MSTEVKWTQKSGRQSLFYQDLATSVSARKSTRKFSIPGQTVSVSTLWRENFANSDLPPPPALTLEDRSDFSPEFGIGDYPMTPEVKSDPITPVHSSSREFSAVKSRLDVSTLKGKQQSLQSETKQYLQAHSSGNQSFTAGLMSMQSEIKQYLQAQSSSNQSFTAGLMSMQSDTNARREKIVDTDRMRDLKDDERYNEIRHIQALEHEMKVASNRSKLAQERGILGQKLLEAIQLLDQIDPLSLLTISQKRVYEIRKKTVQDYEDSYDALGDMLNKLKYISSLSARREEENIASGEDNVNLGHESHHS